jgi:hypothetical protein
MHDNLRGLLGSRYEEVWVDTGIEEMCNGVGLDDAARVGVEVLVASRAVR